MTNSACVQLWLNTDRFESPYFPRMREIHAADST